MTSPMWCKSPEARRGLPSAVLRPQVARNSTVFSVLLSEPKKKLQEKLLTLGLGVGGGGQ